MLHRFSLRLSLVSRFLLGRALIPAAMLFTTVVWWNWPVKPRAIWHEAVEWDPAWRDAPEVAIAPDGRTLAVRADEYSDISLWDAASGTKLSTIPRLGAGKLT